MSDREELIALRRLAELEAKATGKTFSATQKQAGINVSAVQSALNENPLRGLGELGIMLGTGTAGQIAGGLSGIAQGAKNLVFDGGMPAGSRVERVQEAMTYIPRSQQGQQMAKGIGDILGIIPQVANIAGENVSGIAGPAVGAGVNAAMQIAPSAIPLLKTPISKLNLASINAANKANALAQPKNEAILSARATGLPISPAEASGTLLNRIAEGFAGQSKTQQLASQKAQPKLNELVRRNFGIPDDVPLSIDALEKVRRQAGKEYDSVRGIGNIKTDADFASQLDTIEKATATAAKSFPKMVKDDVKSAVDAVRVNAFDSDSAIDAIKIQREAADKAFRSGDTGLGKTHKAIAEAIESQIERHLGATGSDLSGFRNARTIIAQTYDAQKALKGNDIDARVLGKAFEKGRLTGDLKTVGQFGSQFKKSAQTGTGNAYVPSLWETLGLGGLGGIGTVVGTGLGAAPIVAALAAGSIRPAARAAMTSPIGQRLLVGPEKVIPSKTLSALNELANNPVLMNALTVAGMQADK